MRRHLLASLAPVLLLFCAAPAAHAETISYTGNLRTDATVVSCGTGCTLGAGNSDGDYAQYAAVIESFNVSVSSQMQAISFSYGGGINGAGAVIAEGGLEPYLSLFDSSGNFLSSTYSGTTCPAGAQTNSGSGQCYDVSLNGGLLAPGHYQIALTAFSNMSFAENYGSGTLADGFTGLGNLGFGEDLHYAFDVKLTPADTPPPASPVPEPTPLALLSLTGALALVSLKCRQVLNGSL